MLCDYAAGWISGVVSLIIGHPFDTIKIQQQVWGKSFTEAAARIVQHRGWKGYYRGIMVPFITTGMLNAVFFGVYGDVRDYLFKTRSQRDLAFEKLLNTFTVPDSQPHQPQPHRQNVFLAEHVSSKDFQGATFSELFISGSIAGVACLFIAAPAELVKTKLQSQMKAQYFKGPIDCLIKVVKGSGVRGLYRGILPLTLREATAGGSYFVAYEFITKHARKYLEQSDSTTNSLPVQIIGGGFSGVTAWTLILPFDNIKSRMQADNHLNPQYKSMLHCGKEILRTRGIVGLYRGFYSCVARAIPVNATIFVVYEALRNVLC